MVILENGYRLVGQYDNLGIFGQNPQECYDHSSLAMTAFLGDGCQSSKVAGRDMYCLILSDGKMLSEMSFTEFSFKKILFIIFPI